MRLIQRALGPISILIFVAALSSETEVQSQWTAPAVVKSAPAIGAPTREDMPLVFTPNQGQWADSILFRANAGGATMWFSSGGAYYHLSKGANETKSLATDLPSIGGRADNGTETLLLKARFVGAKAAPQDLGLDRTEGFSNFYLGQDHSRWRTNVPGYRAVLYRDIYPDIDLKYYGDGRRMEYDFVVSPGADVDRIRISYEGAVSVAATASGELVVETKWGTVTEQTPLVYQEINGERTFVSAAYVLVSPATFGFKLGPEYNPIYAVVVDPALTYSSYFGGNGDEYACSISADDSGYVYLAGSTISADFPTLNAFDATLNSSRDITITKFTADLHTMVYSTYFGGASDEAWCMAAVDSLGNTFVAGDTRSSDFPLKNAYDGTFKGINQIDAFLAKFDGSGGLVFSTFFGGTGDDENLRLTVDRFGCPYIGGTTRSTNLPTRNAFQSNLLGYEDMFVAKFSSDGQALLYSSYLGGGGAQIDNLLGLAVDTGGCLYVTGHTSSPTYPTTAGAYDRTYGGGYDCPVTKLAADGGSLIYSTFVGGGAYDGGHCIAVDRDGHAYVSGGTASSDFPTVNAFDSTLSGVPSTGSWADGFVFKLSQAGDSLEYSTFIGGSTGDVLGTLVVDDYGRVISSGQTQAADYPTKYAYDSTYNGGWDGTLVILSSGGNKLEYGTYLGGTGDDNPWPIAVDYDGNIFLAGSTSSPNFPLVDPVQSGRNGATDMFIMKFMCDMDSDGLCDAVDNCPMAPNPDQLDADGDGVGDLCDNCPSVYNPGQEDGNGNGKGDVCEFVCGDANHDGVINVGDAVYVINYIFKGGAEPTPVKDAGDANCDHAVNVGDAVYVINYIFKGGLTPCCP